MEITPIFDQKKEQRQMNVVAFMSGSGSNVIKNLEHRKKLEQIMGRSPYNITAVFSDKKDSSNAEKIANDFGIEYLFWCDIDKWYQQHEGLGYDGKNDKKIPKDMRVPYRRMYDSITRKCLDDFSEKKGRIDAIALCGYMSFLTEPILNYATCVNVHPADLRVIYTDEKGKVRRKYTGDNAVRDAIKAGETAIRSSVHIATAEVDDGPILMVSEPVTVRLSYPADNLNINNPTLKQLLEYAPEMLKEVAKYNQNALKEKGDWMIFPKTLEMMSLGRFGKYEAGKIYHKNEANVWVPGEVVLGGMQ